MIKKIQRKTTYIKTPKHNIKIECLYGITLKNQFYIDKNKFFGLCQKGCINFNNKYSCPPYSPNYKNYCANYPYMLVVMLSINLDQLANFGYRDYHKIRISNSVLKIRIENIMRTMETYSESKFLATGACRLCKPCKKKLSKNCAHPDKMRYSLEALGVDCNKLAINVFNKPLRWYSKNHLPKYTSVICALPLKKSNKNILIHLNNKLHEIK